MRALISCLGALGLACGGGSGGGVDAGADAEAAVGQGGEPSAELVVNEVSPRSANEPDWIELLNRSQQAVDLCGYFITDSLDRLDHYLPLGGVAPPDQCPPAMLEAGGRIVIFADEATELGPDHAPFRLGEADEAHVVTTTGRSVDGLVYLYSDPDGDTTLSRAPDGEGLFFPALPTPGQPNAEVAW